MLSEFIQIIVLALIQGITEFLPISSSGHLILVPALTGWPDQGVLTDMVTNVGSLLAVIIYFWRDVLGMMRGSLRRGAAPHDANGKAGDQCRSLAQFPS